MAKEIDIVSANDVKSLKIKLQEMVNEGWNIKGVVGSNPHNVYSEPFVILERTTFDESNIDEVYSQNEDPFPVTDYTQPEPHHQEISISMGGD